jgi:putative SOS response-associated peptidase YedK
MSVLIHDFHLTIAPDELPLWEPQYNIPPTTNIPVIRQADTQRTVSLMRWGLLPSWTKDIKKAPLLNNARAETVAEKSSFRSALKKRRCLIPASGFFEWLTEGKSKLPYYFRRPDDRPMAFAGLWERWGEIQSCTIITTEANEVMEPIHHRMPVILSHDNYSEWLNADEATVLTNLLVPCPAEEIERFAVDPVVNNVRNQGPQCIVPLNSE